MVNKLTVTCKVTGQFAGAPDHLSGNHQPHEEAIMLFSKEFHLVEPATGFEFFDIEIEGDTKRFVDPFAIAQTNQPHCLSMTKALHRFMYDLLSAIKANDMQTAHELCYSFSEPKGTRLGYSLSRRDGHGAGIALSEVFLNALKSSTAVVNGVVQYLEECKLFCEGIDKDITSDITINICKLHLIEFTQDQCQKHGIPTQRTKEKIRYFCVQTGTWQSDYFDLPHAPVQHTGTLDYIILIPVNVLPPLPPYSLMTFYTGIAASFFEKDALATNANCIKKPSKGFKVLRGEMRKLIPYVPSKANMCDFINQHPETLIEYRRNIAFPRLNKQTKKAS